MHLLLVQDPSTFVAPQQLQQPLVQRLGSGRMARTRSQAARQQPKGPSALRLAAADGTATLLFVVGFSACDEVRADVRWLPSTLHCAGTHSPLH